MTEQTDLDIFLVTAPGLEKAMMNEAKANGFRITGHEKGGVSLSGDWTDVWRANLVLRGATRVLVRIAGFRANHFAQLDKRSRQVPWSELLWADQPVKVEVSCKKSRIYHNKAAAERIENAIKDTVGAPISPDAEISIKARIVDDYCTISIDTSGEPLHKRGHKQAVNKAPMRETLAALLLNECRYDGRKPLVDPMCGSGTFVIEAAEMAAGLYAGRARSFAFKYFKNFDAKAFRKMKIQRAAEPSEDVRFFGYDRDKGAIAMSADNAERAGVSSITEFAHQPISELTPPVDEAGLVIINPPYGGRIGDVKQLMALYQTMGKVLKSGFKGWRVAFVTTHKKLALSTGLRFTGKPVAFDHGGLTVKLYISDIK